MRFRRHSRVCVLSIVASLWLLAARSDAGPPTARPTWPASLTATIGDVRVRIDGPKLWTLSRIEYRGSVLGIEDSAYGTVVNIRDVGFIGTAHKEVEPEDVTALRIFVDDVPVEASTTLSRVEGKKFRLLRDSRIRSFTLQSELHVQNDRILQSVRIRSDAAVDLKVIYPLMYAWTPAATEFLFGADNGQEIGGEFLSKAGEKTRYIIEKTVRWAAVYDPVSRKGSVSYIDRLPAKVDGWLQIADAPGIYRKLYLVSFSESTVPAGLDGNFQMTTGFFSADPDRWKPACRATVLQLKGGENRDP